MRREFSVVIEKDEEGYYVASVPALRGCHTQAKSLDTLIERIKEAIELCLKSKNLFLMSLSECSRFRWALEQISRSYRRAID